MTKGRGPPVVPEARDGDQARLISRVLSRAPGRSVLRTDYQFGRKYRPISVGSMSRPTRGPWATISLPGPLPTRCGRPFPDPRAPDPNPRSPDQGREPLARRPGLCLGLHAVGFAMPRMSPPGRCALTAPFHPCLCSCEPSAVCFLLHFPSPAIAPFRGSSGGWALPTTVSCRARTFLKRATRPACGRLAAPFNRW